MPNSSTLRRRAILFLVGIVVLSSAPAAALVAEGERAPEIVGDAWINSAPLSIARLDGRVVLVEFWTYG